MSYQTSAAENRAWQPRAFSGASTEQFTRQPGPGLCKQPINPYGCRTTYLLLITCLRYVLVRKSISAISSITCLVISGVEASGAERATRRPWKSADSKRYFSLSNSQSISAVSHTLISIASFCAPNDRCLVRQPAHTSMDPRLPASKFHVIITQTQTQHRNACLEDFDIDGV